MVLLFTAKNLENAFTSQTVSETAYEFGGTIQVGKYASE